MSKTSLLAVRDALVNCFYEAHCADTELVQDEITGREYCLAIIKKDFDELGVDFDNPTKEGIFKVINKLAEFSKNFRSQEVINKHKQEIINLLEKAE